MTLQPIYDRLSEIKGQLEHLVLTHRWTLRETDLWNFQVSLKEIDRLRVNGKFVDSEGKQPEGQLVSVCVARLNTWRELIGAGPTMFRPDLALPAPTMLWSDLPSCGIL